MVAVHHQGRSGSPTARATGPPRADARRTADGAGALSRTPWRMPIIVSMSRVLDRGARVVFLVAAAGLAGFALHAMLPDGETVSWFFNYPVYFAVIVVAMALSLVRAIASPVHRAGWAAIAVAIWSLGTAEFVWEYVYSNLDDPPFPSWADALYLGFYPASYVGVVLLFRARARGVPAGIWLDGLTATLTAGAVGAAVLVEVVLDTTSGSLSTVATNLAYPLGDVFLLALVVGAFSVTRWRPGGAWLMIGAALTVAAIGDSVYLFQTAKGTYVEGTLLDVTWPTALLLMAWAGWLDRGRARPVDATGRAFSPSLRSAPCSRSSSSCSTTSGRSTSSPSPSRPQHWPPWSVASCSRSGRTAVCWTARDWRRSRIRSPGSGIAVDS